MRNAGYGTRSLIILVCLLGVGLSNAPADMRLPAIIGDNMVLQQGMKLPIWGWADPGETVTVMVDGQKKQAEADTSGRWMVRLDPIKAGGPLQMTVSGKNTTTLQNILVGEVWVCSGQSNMQFSLCGVNHAEVEIRAADYPKIRLFQEERAVSHVPLSDGKGRWEACNPDTVYTFSAVAYFFGRDLHKARNIPIGLIHASYGGSVIEAWIRREVLESDSANKPLLDYWKRLLAKWDTEPYRVRHERNLAEWEELTEKAKQEGKAPPARPSLPGESVHQPHVLYHAMLAPLIPFGIKGVIWYQGEANTSGMRNFSDWYTEKDSPDVAHADRYQAMLKALIENWRKDWGQGDFPFLIVQLPNCGQPKPAENPRDSNWGRLREAQLHTALTVPQTAIAVTVDTEFEPGDPDTGHPKHKQHVGERLALAARVVAYHEKIPYRGPIYQSMKIEGDRIRLKFKHVNGELVAKGETLKWFTIAGADRKFVWADAVIDGETVLVSSPLISKPAAVRYAWDIDPSGCNLYNNVGLPASPFRTDEWPLADKEKTERGNF